MTSQPAPARGTLFAIVGGPGTGKTTLARAMCKASSDCYLTDRHSSAAGIRNREQKFVLLDVGFSYRKVGAVKISAIDENLLENNNSDFAFV